MSKAWYYEVMGSELGPISSADLIDKAKRGQIQPDTRVRSGPEGKWQFADRVKGLFPAPPPPVLVAAPSPPVPWSETIPLADNPNHAGDDDKTYHFTGDSSQNPASLFRPAGAKETQEYDFFQFIGFSQAITPPLHDVLLAYAKTHKLSVTQVTRRALAEFLGRKDLAEDAPPGGPNPPAPAPTEPLTNHLPQTPSG